MLVYDAEPIRLDYNGLGFIINIGTHVFVLLHQHFTSNVCSKLLPKMST